MRPQNGKGNVILVQHVGNLKWPKRLQRISAKDPTAAGSNRITQCARADVGMFVKSLKWVF